MTHESNPYFVDCLQVNKRDPLRQVFVEVHKNFVFCSANLITEAFRFEYEHKVEKENDFSILVCRLYIVTSHSHPIPLSTLSTYSQHE